ncbi:hypothetical protein ES319_A11G303000v1 [Gossypium barbadense]|uniref:Uncharacterized protein n=1 Tax=Gossypium barbadense TaxID=3634 RepID=A0A5J5TUJ9_GOSBA|nr:hypothetical protein ES319_A11G303000v1 [Gossypium barbadense]
MEEDGYDDGDGSYGEEEDDEKAGFLILLNKGCSVNTSGLHVFSNLTQLKLECNEYCGQLLPELLEKSPNLEVLILGKDNAKLNARDLVKIHMGATAVHS